MKKLIMVACLAASLFQSAYAGIVNNTTYITDTSAGLDWLSLSSTMGMDVNVVAGQLGAGGTFSGWKYATNAQVVKLVEDSQFFPVSIPITNISIGTGVYSTFNGLSLSGLTKGLAGGIIPTTGLYGSMPIYGVVADTDSHGTPMIDTLNSGTGSFTQGGLAWFGTFAGIGEPTFIPRAGSFLVRDTIAPVPEPETYAMLLAGLGLIGGITARRKAKQE